MTLTDFLLARIAEDEVTAKEAPDHPDVDTFDSPHQARWWPPRVLADCDAKRLAIDAAWQDHERIENEWGMCQSRDQMEAKNDNPEVVSALAAVYADHPDYREEWAL